MILLPVAMSLLLMQLSIVRNPMGRADEASMGRVLSGPIVVRLRAFYSSPHAVPSQWVRAFRHDLQL